MPYPQQSGGKGILLFLFLLIVLAILFVLFGDRFNLTRNIHDKLFSGIKSLTQTNKVTFNERTIIQPPPSETDWCRIQEIQVNEEDREAPQRNRIVGWDLQDECCVREVQGFNNCLKKQTTLRYCYSSQIGGVIKYTTINGYYVDKDNYKSFLEDIDKYEIQNKPCDIEKYPQQLRA